MNILGYFPCCDPSEISLWLNVQAKNVCYLYWTNSPVFHGVILLEFSRVVDLGVCKFDQMKDTHAF